jgi:hypothetical protein
MIWAGKELRRREVKKHPSKNKLEAIIEACQCVKEWEKSQGV